MNNLLTSSPETLKGLIEKLPESSNRPWQNRLVTLVIDAPEILVCPFEFKSPDLPHWMELEGRLAHEAAQILSLKTPDVVLDFQILDRSPDHLRGILLCAPRKFLNEYLSVCDKNKLLASQITAPILMDIEHFLRHLKTNTGKSVYLDFAKQKVNLVVIQDRKCELLRTIPNDSLEEIREEIIKTIKSACAKSQVKACQHFYYAGDWKGHESLINEVASVFDATVTLFDKSLLEDPVPLAQQYFQVNLGKNHVFSASSRAKILNAMTGVIVFLLLMNSWSGLTALMQQQKIQKLRNSFTSDEFAKAKTLEMKLRE